LVSVGLISSWPDNTPDKLIIEQEKLKMRSQRLFLTLIAAGIALLAIPAIAAAQTTELPGNVYCMSSLLNFTKGQAVSIHFTNVDRQIRDIRLSLLDANGITLKTASGRVVPGQTVSISFSFAELPRTSPTRVGVRGVAVVADPPNPDADPPQPDLSLSNMEVYDVLTGKVTFGLLLPAVRNVNVFFPTDQ
jgi:hypothetical protein